MESFRERNLNFSEFNFGHERSWNNFIELRQMIREQDYSKWNRPHAWTFTFKFEQSHQSAKRKMRHFLNVASLPLSFSIVVHLKALVKMHSLVLGPQVLLSLLMHCVSLVV